MDLSAATFLASVTLFTATAALLDLRTRQLPNGFTIGGLLGAVAFHGVKEGSDGLLFSLGGFAAGFGLLLVLWLIGGGGGGDVKLMGALGAWLGTNQIVTVFLLATLLVLLARLAAAVFHAVAPTALFARQALQGVSAATADSAVDSTTDSAVPLMRRSLPFAVPVAVGTWLSLAWTLWGAAC